MNIQDKIIQNYPLVNKIAGELNCYSLGKRRYLVFWNELIKKESMEEVLNCIEEKTKNSRFSDLKTLIVVAKTDDEYIKKDLLYFNNSNTFIVFYLIDEELNKVYMNDSWIFALGLNYKKYVRKINEILECGEK